MVDDRINSGSKGFLFSFVLCVCVWWLNCRTEARLSADRKGNPECERQMQTPVMTLLWFGLAGLIDEWKNTENGDEGDARKTEKLEEKGTVRVL